MKQFDPLESWLNNVAYSHSDSKSTRINYKYNMERFCAFIDKTPKEIVKDYEQMNDRNFMREYASAIKGMIAELHKNGLYTNSTIRTIVAAIKSFFRYNDLPLSFIPTAKSRVTYHNKEIEREDIAEIINVAKPRDRAFFAFMAQSGLRPATICGLKIKHVEEILEPATPIPCKISVPQEIAKGKFRGYFTFIAEEAVQHLKSYLKTRASLTDDSFLFTRHGTEEKRLTRGSITHIFKHIVDHLSEKGIMDFEQRFNKPSEVRLYNLRKWFRKNAGFAGYDYVHFWMGHKLKNQDEHYFSKDIKLHRKMYREKALPNLRIESKTPIESEKLAKELRGELEELQAKIVQLEEKNLELKARLNGYLLSGDQMQELLKRIENLEKQAKG